LNSRPSALQPNADHRSLQRSSIASSGRLYSLQRLVEDVSDRPADGGPRTIFVGGKGGVGKTTVSAALAVSLASSYDKELKVLVVSTDPAHSLGDALDENLKKAQGKPLQMTDPLTAGRLSACEVDASQALEDFRKNLEAFDIDRLSSALGVPASLLESLGLGEFSGLLNNPPPGLDELVALSNVLDNDSVAGDYDVVVVDTAPTGHTLRLLALPQFLDGLLGKLISLRMKLSGLASTLQAFFGSAEAQQRAKAIDDAVDRLEIFRRKMSSMRQRLQDSEKTKFVVVTIPTKLSVAESKRLVTELISQSVAVTDVVVNQCVGHMNAEEDTEALQGYYGRRTAGQKRWIEKLGEAVDDVSASEEYKSNGSSEKITLTTVPFFDVELVGVPALAYLGSQCFAENPNFAHLMNEDTAEEPKVVICGGKGGVGKTTTSSALAVTMAAKGHNVALISTDPAHSLGDAIDMNLKGGNLMDCPLIGVPPSEGSLSVLEIDPSTALSQFKGVVDQLVGGDESPGSDDGIRNTLRDLGEVFDTLPAGTDEVVALAKIINLVKKGNFDRIVLDTAPTGHTLRMLSTPGFLAELIERLLVIAEKVNSNTAVKMLMSGSARGEDFETAAATAKSTLLSFQLQMYDLEDLFADAEQTEFLIVTVATELAARESIRLLNDLTFEAPDMPIKVRNIVVNQVLSDDGSDAKIFISHMAQSQLGSIEDLERFTSALELPPTITKVEFLDTEPRGVFGLKILAEEMLRE
jgi:arsenite-transporting ATPase